MKYLGLALLTLFASVVLTSAASHNYSWGTINPGDILLDRNVLAKTYQSNTITLGYYAFESNKGANIYLITGIRLIDRYIDGKGGYASLDHAGPGFTSMGINLKSQRGGGYNFIIEIYGRPVS